MPINSWIASFVNLRSRGRPASFAESARIRTNPRWNVTLIGSLLWLLMLWVAWVVRLWRLDASDLTFDEAATYVVANRPLLDILAYLRQAVREHPPVFYLLIRPWMTLAGISEFSLRFFAVGASMVGIALTARLARSLGRRSGINASVELFVASYVPALILALFPFEVYYAREARMYTLAIVLAALSSLLFLPLLFEKPPGNWPNPVRLLGLVLVNGLAVFTHYYLGLLIVTQFVTLLSLRRWRVWIAWSASHGLVGLFGLVWLALAPGLSSTLTEVWGRFNPAWPTADELRRLIADLLFGPIRGVPWNVVYSWGALITLGLFVAWLRFVRTNKKPETAKTPRQGAEVNTVWLTVTLLVPIALAYLVPEAPSPRLLIFVLPFAALAIGQIPFLFVDKPKVVLAGLGLAALAISTLGIFGLPRTVRWIKSNYGRTIATVSAHARPGDSVLFYGPWQWIQFHYYDNHEFPPITALPPRAPPQLVPDEAAPVLEDLFDTFQRIWVIPAAVDDVDPLHFVDGWLDANAHPIWASPELSLHLPPWEQEALSLPVEITYGDRLRLASVSSNAQTVPAGEGLRLMLTWAVSDTLDTDLKTDWSLVDERGNRWLQWNQVPRQWSNPPSTWVPGAVITDRQGVMVPQGAPPGRYRLQLTVVDSESGAPLAPSGADGPFHQDAVDLLSFEVTAPISPPVLAEAGDYVGPFVFASADRSSEKTSEEAPVTLTLAGYELGGLKFTQGNPLSVRLHWLAGENPLPDLELRLQLLHRSRRGVFANKTTPLVTETLSLVPDYPASEWPTGRLVSLLMALSIPTDAAPGTADLALSVLGPDGQPWAIAGDPYLFLGTLTVQERPLLREIPKDLTAVRVDYVHAGIPGDQIGLRGYRVDGEAQPGGNLDLTYAWYAVNAPDQIYSVFNHLLTADGQYITQVDGWPQSGAVPTNQWRPGEYIWDRHVLEIPESAPPGPYILAVGLYNAANRERLQALFDGQPLPNDQWLLPVGGGQGE